MQSPLTTRPQGAGRASGAGRAGLGCEVPSAVFYNSLGPGRVRLAGALLAARICKRQTETGPHPEVAHGPCIHLTAAKTEARPRTRMQAVEARTEAHLLAVRCPAPQSSRPHGVSTRLSLRCPNPAPPGSSSCSRGRKFHLLHSLLLREVHAGGTAGGERPRPASTPAPGLPA